MDVVICTSDKDARQLLDEHTRILNLTQNKFLDVDGLKADWGIRPDQVVDYLALTGDAVDNVPGVPGIGPKTASELIEQFDDLDNLLDERRSGLGREAAAEPPRIRRHGPAGQAARRSCRKTCRSSIDWDELKVGSYDSKALKALCFECGFHPFLNEIVDEGPPEPAASGTRRRIRPSTRPRPSPRSSPNWQSSRNSASTPRRRRVDPLRADLVGLSFSLGRGDRAITCRSAGRCSTACSTRTRRSMPSGRS